MNNFELWQCDPDKIVLLGHAICAAEELKIIFHRPTKTTFLLTKSNKSGHIDAESFEDQHDGELAFDSLCVFGGYTYIYRDRFKGIESNGVTDRKNLLK